MENKERILFRKIEENGHIYRIRATIGLKCLSLMILCDVSEKLSIYTSSMILEDALKIQADKLDKRLDDYFEKLVSYFENVCHMKFILENDTLTLVDDVNSHLQAKYFYCKIQKISNDKIGIMIDDLQIQNVNLNKQCERLSLKNEQLHRDVTAYKEKLNELIDRKKVDEQTMLSNFVLLLNEKKRRIQHLNELLEEFRCNPSSVYPVDLNVNIPKKKKLRLDEREQTHPQVQEEISETDSDFSDENNSKKNAFTDVEKLKYTLSEDDPFEEPFSEKDPSLNHSTEKYLPLNSLPSTSRIMSTELLNKSTKDSICESPHQKIIDTQELLNNL